MNAQTAMIPDYEDETGPQVLTGYLEMLALVERLHRLLLEVVRDEFERAGRLDINAVQALLLFNIGNKTMTAGELRHRGYYQGSNVSYNLKKLVEAGYIDHRRSDTDRRAVRIRLTEKGMDVHFLVADLFRRHADELAMADRLGPAGLDRLNADLRRVDRYWSEELRYVA
jgi:DNA-binding MarR family transcriptional regulator